MRAAIQQLVLWCNTDAQGGAHPLPGPFDLPACSPTIEAGCCFPGQVDKVVPIHFLARDPLAAPKGRERDYYYADA